MEGGGGSCATLLWTITCLSGALSGVGQAPVLWVVR